MGKIPDSLLEAAAIAAAIVYKDPNFDFHASEETNLADVKEFGEAVKAYRQQAKDRAILRARRRRNKTGGR